MCCWLGVSATSPMESLSSLFSCSIHYTSQSPLIIYVTSGIQLDCERNITGYMRASHERYISTETGNTYVQWRSGCDNALGRTVSYRSQTYQLHYTITNAFDELSHFPHAHAHTPRLVGVLQQFCTHNITHR